jgi:hypothetical protein
MGQAHILQNDCGHTESHYLHFLYLSFNFLIHLFLKMFFITNVLSVVINILSTILVKFAVFEIALLLDF